MGTSTDVVSRRTFTSWVVYFIAILYIACVLASAGYGYFGLFLKSLKNPDGTKVWTVSQINAIPIGGGAIQVVFGMHPRTSRSLMRLAKQIYSLDLGSFIRFSGDQMDFDYRAR